MVGLMQSIERITEFPVVVKPGCSLVKERAVDENQCLLRAIQRRNLNVFIGPAVFASAVIDSA